MALHSLTLPSSASLAHGTNSHTKAAAAAAAIAGAAFFRPASRALLEPSLRQSSHKRNLSAIQRPNASSSISSAVSDAPKSITLTFLEGNSWLWDVGGVKLLVDPVLVGNLDFGVPWLYDGAKKLLRTFKLEDLPVLDCLLITQSLDDHCHVRTLRELSRMLPDVPVIATPNAESILEPLFKNVTYLEPGQASDVQGKNGVKVNVRATAGPVLGPPWQKPENGYIIKCGESSPSLYYEPHCVYNNSFLQGYQADIVITPVIKQLLPSFTLVSGQEDAVQLAKLLNAKYVVTMNNGDLDTKGLLSTLLTQEGTTKSFKELLSRELPDASVLVPTPGEPLEIPMSLAVS